MKIAILGCGLIGKKRGGQLSGHELVGVYDPVFERAELLALELMTHAYSSADELLQKKPDIVIVATTNNALAPMTQLALNNGCHVLVEKPAGISVSELDVLIANAKKKNLAVNVGFN